MDAQYYVALGRRSQSWEDFSRGAEEVVGALEKELEKLAGSSKEGRRALEIGCGPGRLMLPLSRHFREIHGVDVSTEMVRLARQNLGGIPHAHVHASTGTNLSIFDDEYFDFVYSFAVFQHIPSSEVVTNYVKETRRVLKTGGAARMHFNGSRKTVGKYDTWCGTQHSSDEIASIARDHDLLLLALEGVDTADMWATFVKPSTDSNLSHHDASAEASQIVIRDVTPADPSVTEVPTRGRYASFALHVQGMPSRADLNTMQAFVSGRRARLKRVEGGEEVGLLRAVADLPRDLPSGRHPVQLTWKGAPVRSEGALRVVPPAPEEPRVVSVTDGIFVGCGTTITSNIVKVSLQESHRPEDLRATVSGQPTRRVSAFCSAPNIPRFEIYLKLPARGPRGAQALECWLGSRSLGVFEINISKDRFWWWRHAHPAEMIQAVRRLLWMLQQKYWTKDKGTS